MKITLIALACGLIIFYWLLVTWTQYLAVENLNLHRDGMNKFARGMGYILLVRGTFSDFIWNVLATVLFLEPPQEFLFTARVNRCKAGGGWWKYNQPLAVWFCDNLLNPFAPGGKHCKASQPTGDQAVNLKP